MGPVADGSELELDVDGLDGPPASDPQAPEVESKQLALAVSSFHGFSAVPGGLSNEGPAVVTRGGNLDLYVRGLDYQMYSNYWSSLTGWLGWHAMGGVFTSKPSATVVGGGLAVAGRGLDSGIWIDVSLPPGGSGHPVSSGWLRIPGESFTGAPAIAFFNNKLYAFAVRANGALYSAQNALSTGSGGALSYAHSGWTSWTEVPGGGVFSSEPAAQVQGGKLVVVGRGLDRMYWISSTFGSSWTSWFQLPGGVFSSGPALAAYGSGDVHVFGRGLDGAYWVASGSGTSFGAFARIPDGLFDSGPAAVSFASDEHYLFGIGMDEAIYVGHSAP